MLAGKDAALELALVLETGASFEDGLVLMLALWAALEEGEAALGLTLTLAL